MQEATPKQQEKLTFQLMNSDSETWNKVWEERPDNFGAILQKIPKDTISQIIGIIDYKKTKEYRRVIKYFKKIGVIYNKNY